MADRKWLDLQLFGGEGAGASGGEGGGEGADTGSNTADAGRQRLLELGVPESKLRKNRQYSMPKAQAARAPAAEEGQPATGTEETAPREEAKEASRRMSWDEIQADPEYQGEMQKIVNKRLKSAKAAEENMGKLAPALELLARNYGLDPAKPDFDALSKAIIDDGYYYEQRAIQLGVDVDTAKGIEQREQDKKRQQQEQSMTLEQEKIRQHIAGLEQQGEAMKKIFPNFDLKVELQNPAFARMTSPNGGVSVEDAYYAIHRREIQAAAMQVTAQKTAQSISNSIQAGQKRPDEAGTSGQAPSVTSFDYSKASREQREALKQRIRYAAAHGEKIYPGA